MTKESFIEFVKADVKNTVISYFSPVTAVINEISRQVIAETSRPMPEPKDKP
jgi:hypothetical protein